MNETARLVLAVDSTDVDKGSASLDKIGRHAGEAEKSTTRATSQMEGGFKAVRAAIAAVASSAALRKIVGDLASFDQAMRGVQAVSGATAEQMAVLEDQARELGATSMFSAQQAADAQRFLAQAGFEVNEVLGATPGILQLAAAAGMDLGSAADLASNALSGFRLEVAELGRVNDVLAATAASANTDVTQLGQALSFAAPIATAAGVSVEETAAAIGALSDAGIQASRAGTGFVGFIRQLSNITPQAAAALESYGISVSEVDITTRGLQSVIDRLAAANIETADAFKIFGSEAGAAAQVLLGSSERVSELTTSLGDAEGAASRMAEILGSGLTGSLRAFGSAAAEATLQLGDGGVGGELQSLIDTATGVISVYNGMLPQFAEANDLSAEQAANLENLAGAVQIIAAAAGGYATYTIAVKGATVAMAAFNAAARTNPVGVVVSAVAAASAAIAAFGGDTDDASKAIARFRREMDQTAPSVDTLISKYEELNEVQREGLRIKWAEQQRLAAESAKAAFEDLAVEARNSLGSLGGRGQDAEGLATYQGFKAFREQAREAFEEGENLLPLIDEFGEKNGLSEQAINSLKTFAIEIDTATQRGEEFERLLDRVSGRGEIINYERSKRIADEIIAELEDAQGGGGGGGNDKATDSIQKRVAALQLEAETLGMTARQEELYRARKEGATAAQLAAIDGSYRQMEAYESEQKALEFSIKSRRDAAEILAEMDKERATDIDAGEQLLERYMTDEELLREHHERRLETLEDARAADFDNEAKWNSAIEAENKRFNDAMEDMDRARWMAQMDLAASGLSEITGLMSSENRKMFEIGKAAAIAQTLVSIPSSAQKAFDAMSGIPIVGPALGAAAAAAAVVAGMGRLQAIKSANFGGGGGGGSGGGGISGGVQSVPAAPAPVQLDGASGGGRGGDSISITVNGSVVGATKDELAEMFGDALKERINNKDWVMIDANSRNGRTLR